MTVGEEEKFYRELKRAVLADDQKAVEILAARYPRLFAKVMRKAQKKRERAVRGLRQ